MQNVLTLTLPAVDSEENHACVLTACDDSHDELLLNKEGSPYNTFLFQEYTVCIKKNDTHSNKVNWEDTEIRWTHIIWFYRFLDIPTLTIRGISHNAYGILEIIGARSLVIDVSKHERYLINCKITTYFKTILLLVKAKQTKSNSKSVRTLSFNPYNEF